MALNFFKSRFSPNNKSEPNKSLIHDIDDTGLSSIPAGADLFASVRAAKKDNDPSVFNQSLQDPALNNTEHSDYENNSSYAQAEYSSYSSQVQEESADNGPIYHVGPTPQQMAERNYRSYLSDASYLNEEGRESGHLYIGPGEPLRKASERREEIEKQVKNEAVVANVPLSAGNQNIAAPDFTVQTQSTERAQVSSAEDLIKAAENLNSISANTVQGSSTEQPKANREFKPKVSLSLHVMLFVRQLFASVFNFTNLGAVFPKQALNVLGPSSPAFMAVPYFIVGFICSSFVVLAEGIVKPTLTSLLVCLFYILLTGCNCFRGLGNLLTALSMRKIDFYCKACVVLVSIHLFGVIFNIYITDIKMDLSFILCFSVMTMLSAFSAATLNYGDNDDPVSSYGTLSLKGLLVNAVIVLAVIFALIQWQVALSMIGIALLCRVLVGQYMYLKGIRASISNVCGLQYLTLLLLMTDLLLTGINLSFKGPLLP
ncbi:MAG: hypothetical protein ACI4NE_02810 [Succinivibrio sp.]